MGSRRHKYVKRCVCLDPDSVSFRMDLPIVLLWLVEVLHHPLALWQNRKAYVLRTCFHNALILCHEQYDLAADPEKWGSHLSPSFAEDDDELHKPDNRDRINVNFITYRGLTNLGCILLLGLALLSLLCVYPPTSLRILLNVHSLGYPVVHHLHSRRAEPSTGGVLNVVNGSDQVLGCFVWLGTTRLIYSP